ncbi:MAG: ArsR family transcriptional regulator [Candidatus Thorarchaeota archaeon]
MERLAELLFELSNYDRLEILFALQKEDMKLTQISKSLALTPQETSRHLARLSESRLIDKRANGDYFPTEYCTQILNLLPSFKLLLAKREYFIHHSLQRLPRGFASRIGDLVEGRLIDNAILLFQMVDTLIVESKEFVWILADQALSSTLPLLMDALERGIEFRSILPKSLGPPLLPPEVIPDFSRFRENSMLNRHLDTVNSIVIVSENKGVISFPTLDGKMDYTGFIVDDEIGIGWCRDLFLHDWERAVPI